MIYVPSLNDYKCYVVQNADTIRGYVNIPNSSGNYQYRDFYINSSYVYRDGTQTFSNMSTYPTCLQSTEITDNFFYRNDFDKICLIFVCFFIVSILIGRMVLRAFFRGWFK